MSDDKKLPGPEIVDLTEKREELRQRRANAGFFDIAPIDYTKCQHDRHGVTLNKRNRVVTCRGCHEVVDAFDALMHYAHSERRLQSTKEFIEEHRRKEAEKAALRHHVKRVTAARAIPGGRVLTLECGHAVTQYGRAAKRHTHVRTASCRECLRAKELKDKGVGVIDSSKEALHV